LPRNPTCKQLAEFLHIFVTKFSTHKPVAQKRRIADDEIHFRPVGEQGVSADYETKSSPNRHTFVAGLKLCDELPPAMIWT
jgi:hypothetical protein